jgi:TRAP-type mannitol/chloroaromatic compound transport system substrate-binding protein
MKRRNFLRRALAVSAAAPAAGLGTSALGQGRRELRMVTAWPRNLPGLGTGAERLARAIGEATDGTLQIKVFAAGELVPASGAFDAVIDGTADLYHAPDYYFRDKSPAFNFFTTIPFGMTAAEMDAWIYHGGGQQLWDELHASFGTKPLLAGNSGVQAFGWFRREIKTIEDFKGLRFRVSGLAGEVLENFGVTAVSLPPNEIFAAFKKNELDAVEWIGPWNDLALGLHRLARFYYFPGVMEPSAALTCGFNKRVWDGLSPSHKRAIADAVAADNQLTQSEFYARNIDALETLKGEHGVQIRRLSDDIVRQLGAAAGDAVARFGRADAATRKIYDSYLAFRKRAIVWSGIALQSTIAARALPFKFGK